MSGFVVALALALLAYVRVSADGLTYRNPEVWSNEATLQLSDPSYPELRSKLPPTSDPNRFLALVDQYAEFATSDAVMRSLRKQRLVGRGADPSGVAGIAATSVASPVNGSITPLLKITGMAGSPSAATRLTIRATDTFIQVAKGRQVQAKIPESQRIELRIVKRSGVPKLIAPRSKTTFIIILLAGLTVTVAAAFIRENHRQATSRKSEPDTASVFDLEAQPPASNGSDPVRAVPQPGSRSEPTEPEDGEAGVRSVIRTRASSSG
jgi:capsular polysaccharide biosynthesis protein